MNTLILFLKGLIIGIGKIIPGVSGSLLAISLGVYEEAISKIETLWKTKKASFCFLFPLAIGIIVAILFGSNIMLYFLNHYYLFTVMVFIGLIVGTVPNIVKKETIHFKDYIIIGGIILIFFYLETHLHLPQFEPNSSIFSSLYIVLLGFIDALTTVLPGISGTATYMMLGSYNFILELFANPFQMPFYCVLFGIGLLVGIAIMIKVVNYCFKKKKHLTWMCIIGFLFSSILSLFLKIIDGINRTNLFPLILLFIISYTIINMVSED